MICLVHFLDIWLKNGESIPQQVSTMNQIFILKKKFFITEATVNQDDPVQLHLIYCQVRYSFTSNQRFSLEMTSWKESIPVPKKKLLVLQLSKLNFPSETTIPMFILPDRSSISCWRTFLTLFSLKEYFPPQYRSKEMEKKLFEEWKKLFGMNEINARYRYVQLCRSLKTYGMTVFKVKVHE